MKCDKLCHIKLNKFYSYGKKQAKLAGIAE